MTVEQFPRKLEDIPLVLVHGVPSAASLQRGYESTLERQRERYGPAKTTLGAAAWLARYGDPKRFDAWLNGHSSQEQLAILEWLEQRNNNPPKGRGNE